MGVTNSELLMLAIFTRFKSNLLEQKDPPAILPVPQPDPELQVPRSYTVARKSFGKRMRCEPNDDNDGQQEVSHLPTRKHSFYEFATAIPLSSINLKMSKSDYQLKSSREVVEKPFDFTPGKLSTSVSHPCFPLSHPHNLLEPQKAGSPEGRGKHDEGNPSTNRFAFTFSNPRPVSAKRKAATNINGTSECKTPVTSSTECFKAFQSARKVSECNEANLLEEARRNSLMMDSTPQHCRTIHSSPRLDDAFLVTPLPGISQSPNLLEKIKTEIAERHRFSPCTPHPLVEASVQVNDSYKEAVLGENYPFPLPEPLSLRFDTSNISTRVEDIGDMRESGEDSAGTEKSGVSTGDTAVAGGDTVDTDKVDCIGKQDGEDWSDKVRVIFVLSANSSNNSTSERLAEKTPDQERLSAKPLVDAARLQSHTSNLPPPPLSSSITVQKPRLRAVKKSEKHAGHKFQTPSASPRLFAFGRSSPWFRNHKHAEHKFNK